MSGEEENGTSNATEELLTVDIGNVFVGLLEGPAEPPEAFAEELRIGSVLPSVRIADDGGLIPAGARLIHTWSGTHSRGGEWMWFDGVTPITARLTVGLLTPPAPPEPPPASPAVSWWLQLWGREEFADIDDFTPEELEQVATNGWGVDTPYLFDGSQGAYARAIANRLLRNRGQRFGTGEASEWQQAPEDSAWRRRLTPPEPATEAGCIAEVLTRLHPAPTAHTLVAEAEHLIARSAGRYPQAETRHRETIAKYRKQPAPLSLTNLEAALVALEHAGRKLRYSRGSQPDRSDAVLEITWTTSAITLSDTNEVRHHLGRFDMNLVLGNGGCKGYATAREPHPAAGAAHVTHPHVSEETICLGDGWEKIRNFAVSGSLDAACDIVDSVMNTYDPAEGGPYVMLEDWDGTPCYGCEGRIAEDEDRTCRNCDERFCGDCGDGCMNCGAWFCSNCQEGCEDGDTLSICCGCQEKYCSACHGTCPGCNKAICMSCARAIRNGR